MMKKIAIIGIHSKFYPLFIPLAQNLIKKGNKVSFLFTTPIEQAYLRANNLDFTSERNLSGNNLSSDIKQEIKKIAESEAKVINKKYKQIIEKKLYKDLLTKSMILDDFFKKEKIDLLIVWNGTFNISAAGVYLAKKQKIKTLFFENGVLSNTLQIDQKGINVKASFGKKLISSNKINSCKLNHSTLTAEKNKIPIIIRKPSKIKLIYLVLKQIFSSFYVYYNPMLSYRTMIWQPMYKNCFLKQDRINLPTKFIFFPFQVFDDTQISVNSSNFKSMGDALDYIYPILKETCPEYYIIIKEHPADLGRINYSILKRKYPDIIWLKKFPEEKLLEKTSLVITINSSVGVKALTYNKPVVTLGNAFYNINKVVFFAKTPALLPKTIKKAINEGPDLRLIDQFMINLKSYLFSGSWSANSANEIKAINNWIMEYLEEK